MRNAWRTIGLPYPAILGTVQGKRGSNYIATNGNVELFFGESREDFLLGDLLSHPSLEETAVSGCVIDALALSQQPRVLEGR